MITEMLSRESLETVIRGRGLEILVVSVHQSDPTVMVVYVHGNSGQGVSGEARSVIRGIPGVLNAVASEASENIILVKLAVEGR